MSRTKHINLLKTNKYDVLVMGGGINGATSAASLSAQGYQVALIDQADYASKTSQASSNLIWGGIKYLENFEFQLVNNLCKSRNQLMRAYPSLIKEVRFFIPFFGNKNSNNKSSFKRHPLVLKIGTWLYWFMGRCFTLKPKNYLKKHIDKTKYPLNQQLKGALEYSDAYLPENDARLVYRLLDKAKDNGAVLLNYIKLRGRGDRDGDYQEFTLQDQVTHEEFKVKAKWLINAGGPWVDKLNQHLDVSTGHRHLFSKGVHLIFKRIFAEEKVISFFDENQRLFFAIPMGHRTVIGTTDTRVEEPEPVVTPEDRDFILTSINQFLASTHQLVEKDIISERCGVRALVMPISTKSTEDNWLQLSRKHIIEVDADQRVMALFGGKLTDCINIGEEACRKLKPYLTPASAKDKRQPWYGEGADERKEVMKAWAEMNGGNPTTAKDYIVKLWWRRYGIKALHIIRTMTSLDELIEVITGSSYYQPELRYIVNHEQVVDLDDLLRRRTKLALTEKKEELENNYFLKNLLKSL